MLASRIITSRSLRRCFRTSHIAVLIASCLLLAACAEPTTLSPTLSQADLDREAQIQRDMVAQQKNAEAVGEAMETREEMLARLNRVAAPIEGSTGRLCKQMSPASGCRFDVKLAEGGPLNAWADGSSVTVTPAMMRFTQSDDELAFILAHEMGHNMMAHSASQQQNRTAGGLAGMLVDGLLASQGYNTGGTFSDFGGTAAADKYSKAFEREADYTGMYLMADAGYPYQNSGAIWRRMTLREPDTAFLSTSHPSNPERYVAIENIAREIDQKKQSGQPLLPTMRKPA